MRRFAFSRLITAGLAFLALAVFTLPPDGTPASAASAATHQGETIGYSVDGRPIEAYTVGWGDMPVVLVGAIHGGSEWATFELVSRAAEYFRLRAAEVPADLKLIFIPNANPDGVAVGRKREGRFNARQVDLNRNWDCDWSPTSTWNGATVSGGTAPFSEPETQALRDYLLQVQPALVAFYHSQAGSVGAGVCAESLPESVSLARQVARATGYRYVEVAFYEVTGDATGYLNQEGIPSIEIELWTHSNMDWDINLAGMRAMMRWAAAGGAD